MKAFPQELRDLAIDLDVSDKVRMAACKEHLDVGTPETLITYRVALIEWNGFHTRFDDALRAYMAAARK